MFPNLKLQIFRRGDRQNHLAKAVGIDETVLSKIIHGYRVPTPAQRQVLASYLEAEEEWLFESFDAPPHLSRLERVRVAGANKAADNGDV
jgi:transcriptional regulator with XRE-family HTH domain